uniref:Glutaredoxin domain-containing protein n=1 Tax=Strongyloides papillosus TaxID=174720 RepID=A0A0N5B3G6_STREA
MDPLWNGEPPYYTNHTSTYYHQLNIPSVSSPITTTTTMTPSTTNEVIVNGIRMGENELVNIYQENNSNTFNFPRYETIECPYTEPPPPSIGGGYHSSTTPIQRGPSTTSNSIGHDNNDLINDPYYYTEHQNPRTSRNVYFNNEENQSYVNNHYNIYNNIEELYDGGNNSEGNVNDGGIRNIQRNSPPTTILSEPPINFTSLEDDEPLVSEDQLQDEMDHFENMLSKFSSKDLDENCPDLTCDDMLNCFETSIDDNFLKLFDSIESSPEVTSKNSLVSPINDILEDECTDNAGDEEEENKKDKTKIDNNSNGKKKCITCCKEIIKNVFKLSQDKFKSIIYCSSQCIKKKLQEWGEKCKNRKTIEVKLFDDDNVKKKMPFDDAYKFLKKSPFYVPVFIEDKGIEDGDSSSDSDKKEEMLRNGFKKLTFKIFLLLLKKNEIEAGKERMVKAFINELERQIFEKFMGKDYCDYKKFARYFMHNQEKPEKKV